MNSKLRAAMQFAQEDKGVQQVAQPVSAQINEPQGALQADTPNVSNADNAQQGAPNIKDTAKDIAKNNEQAVSAYKSGNKKDKASTKQTNPLQGDLLQGSSVQDSLPANSSAQNGSAQNSSTKNTPSQNTLTQGSGEQESIKTVNVSICGTHHRLTCPADGIDTLNAAVDAINDAIKNLRRQVRGKSPSNEQMLALYCLGLYDELQTAKAQLAQNKEASDAVALHLDKLIQDTKQATVG